MSDLFVSLPPPSLPPSLPPSFPPSLPRSSPPSSLSLPSSLPPFLRPSPLLSRSRRGWEAEEIKREKEDKWLGMLQGLRIWRSRMVAAEEGGEREAEGRESRQAKPTEETGKLTR